MEIDGIIIDNFINQCDYLLIGGIWTDENGAINVVGMIEKDGCLMPDFPSMENVIISDVKQIGIKRD